MGMSESKDIRGMPERKEPELTCVWWTGPDRPNAPCCLDLKNANNRNDTGTPSHASQMQTGDEMREMRTTTI